MQSKRILIIGLGKIGLNHLKGFEKYKNKVEIYVFDKKKINKKNIRNKTKILKSLKDNSTYDLVIISTNSSERFGLFLELVKFNKVKNIIFEKFVFFKKDQFIKTIQILNRKKIYAWVNCIRREILIFKKLKEKLKEGFNINYTFKNWGLGCNAIHFLDLFCFLSDSNKIKVIEKNLDTKIFNSKRKGYMEFKGLLKFKIGNSYLTIQDNNKFTNKTFQIISKKKIFSFNKNENLLTEKDILSGYRKIYKCEKPIVSLISSKVIKKILNNEKILLPTLKESFVHHNILIDILSNHLKKNNLRKKLKIT